MLPELPSRLPTASILVGDTNGSWHGAPDARLGRDRLQLPIGPLRKRRMLTAAQDAEDGPHPAIIFDDLPVQSDSENGRWTGNVNVVCLTRQLGPCFDLSRPQGMLPPERCIRVLPPKSIHYEVFARRLEAMEGGEAQAEVQKQ